MTLGGCPCTNARWRKSVSFETIKNPSSLARSHTTLSTERSSPRVEVWVEEGNTQGVHPRRAVEHAGPRRTSNRTFGVIGLDPKTAPMLKEMLDADGSPGLRQRLDLVDRLPDEEKTGKLTAGFGAEKTGPRSAPSSPSASTCRSVERADPHHQDRLGRQEHQHRLPPAQRRAVRVQRGPTEERSRNRARTSKR
jgi:hypothetical protein